VPNGLRFSDRPSPPVMAEKVVAFTGSLRRGSFNRALIHAAQEASPEGMTIELIEIAELPFYNADPPELLVARAHERFDPRLRLTDEGTRRILAELLERFRRWIAREQWRLSWAISQAKD
jgi:hypothetical protein